MSSVLPVAYPAGGHPPGSRTSRSLLAAVALAVLWFGLGLLVILAATALAALAGLHVLPEGSTRIIDDPVWDTALLLAAVAVATSAVLLTAGLVERRRPGLVTSVQGRLRWPLLLRAAVLALPASAVGLVSFGALSGPLVPPGPAQVPAEQLAAAYAVVLLATPFRAAAEEYLRGWCIQATRRAWAGVVVSAVVFTALHAPSTGWGVLALLLVLPAYALAVLRWGGVAAPGAAR